MCTPASTARLEKYANDLGNGIYSIFLAACRTWSTVQKFPIPMLWPGKFPSACLCESLPLFWCTCVFAAAAHASARTEIFAFISCQTLVVCTSDEWFGAWYRGQRRRRKYVSTGSADDILIPVVRPTVPMAPTEWLQLVASHWWIINIYLFTPYQTAL